MHLDRGYDDQVVRDVLAERGLLGRIAQRGVPAPIQLGRCWVIERTHAWDNTLGKLRWCSERRRRQVEFCGGADGPVTRVRGALLHLHAEQGPPG